jgi:hypothetical protein
LRAHQDDRHALRRLDCRAQLWDPLLPHIVEGGRADDGEAELKSNSMNPFQAVTYGQKNYSGSTIILCMNRIFSAIRG